MKREIRIALLDMNNGKPNQGFRCIKNLTEDFLKNVKGEYSVFDVRKKNEIPNVKEFDFFVSSGGPGSPFPEGLEWENKFNQFLDELWIHNEQKANKKFAFLICHSFQLACHYWKLGNVCRRKSTSFGIMPIHKTDEGQKSFLFESLSDPFYAVDSRDFQVIEPNDLLFEKRGSQILALEKKRDYIDLERAMMAIQFSTEIYGTQFHPEADAKGMGYHFSLDDKRQSIIELHGKQKYNQILFDLQDSEKIQKTQKVILPNFFEFGYQQMLKAENKTDYAISTSSKL